MWVSVQLECAVCCDTRAWQGDEEDGLVKFFKISSFGKAISFFEQAYSQPFPFELSFLSQREEVVMKWVRQMPNTVKVSERERKRVRFSRPESILALQALHTLMKLSFQLEPPSGRELKASVYKKYWEKD